MDNTWFYGTEDITQKIGTILESQHVKATEELVGETIQACADYYARMIIESKENPAVQDIDGEFFEFTHIVEAKQIGETVTLTVRRKGEPREVPVKLKAWGARMSPSVAYDRRAEYLVLGGYVFVSLTTNYLMATRASDDLVYYYQQYYRIVAEEAGPQPPGPTRGGT